MPTTPTPTTSHRPSPLATSSTSFATASHAMTRTLSLLFLALSLAACPRGGAETPRQVTIDDAAAADEIFSILMGEDVESRRGFIQRNAKDVRFLDI